MAKKPCFVHTDIVPCVHCHTPAALLVFVNGSTKEHLMDCATRMASQIEALAVPTWIVGTEREVCVDGVILGEALIMRVWPEWNMANSVLSADFNTQLEQLSQTHCL